MRGIIAIIIARGITPIENIKITRPRLNKNITK
jgi:hypothetical protein